jgi:hypothetical protein
MTMKKLICLLVLTAVATLGVHAFCFADSEESEPQEANAAPRKQGDQSSANFNKTTNFIPGEEVITPTGKKLKVWSTTGPVPVSRAPDPFEDREKSVLPAGGVIVDTRGVRPLVPQNGNSNLNAAQTGDTTGTAAQPDRQEEQTE